MDRIHLAASTSLAEPDFKVFRIHKSRDPSRVEFVMIVPLLDDNGAGKHRGSPMDRDLRAVVLVLKVDRQSVEVFPHGL